MNFGQLITNLSQQIFPEGEAVNLVAPHRSFFVEALYDLQKYVPCLTYNNTDVYDHCATYFNCGMTVLPAPRGHIVRVYTVDRVNPDTGEEDIDSVPDWCSKVTYQQVDYCHLLSYSALCERCSGSSAVAVADALVAGYFGVFRPKRTYPPPSDVGFETQPTLPPGFFYPQAATDASGRSPSGVWAMYRGRIYVAPWIQSTESLVIEWNGIKRIWSNSDLVDDDPKFLQAVRTHVAMQDAFAYNNDTSRYAVMKDQFYGNVGLGIPGVLPEMVHECREETRLRRCNETAASSESAARGLGNVSSSTGGKDPDTIFHNDVEKIYTAYCSTGQTGGPATGFVGIGEASSPISVADANGRAQQLAVEKAQQQLVCSETPVEFENAEYLFTATCEQQDEDAPLPTGIPVSVIIPAGKWSAATQEAADALAELDAQTTAYYGLTCTFYNSAVTKTAACPDAPATTSDGTVGASEMNVVVLHATPAAQAAAQTSIDAQAENEALIRASAALVCPILYVPQFNFVATASKVYVCTSTGGGGGFSMRYTRLPTPFQPGVFWRLITRSILRRNWQSQSPIRA